MRDFSNHASNRGPGWETDIFEGGGYENTRRKEIGMLGDSSCEEAAGTLYHEAFHAAQPSDLTTRQSETRAYRYTEAWRIGLGLSGRSGCRRRRSNDSNGRPRVRTPRGPSGSVAGSSKHVTATRSSLTESAAKDRYSGSRSFTSKRRTRDGGSATSPRRNTGAGDDPGGGPEPSRSLPAGVAPGVEPSPFSRSPPCRRYGRRAGYRR